MSDVYKFRVTIELEIATHESPRTVRDFLKTFTEEALTLEKARIDQHRGDTVDCIHKFHVRTKRLDDWAPIGPPVRLRLAKVTCPGCGAQMAEVLVNQLPFQCPICNVVIPIDAEGQVRP